MWRSRAVVHRRFDYLAGRASRRAIALAAHRRRRVFYWFQREARRVQGPHRSGQARPRPAHVPGQQVLPRRPVRPTSIVAAIKGPVAACLVLGQPERDRRGAQRRRPRRRGARSRRLRLRRPEGRRRRGQRRWRERPARPVACCGTSSRAGYSATRCSCSARSGSLRLAPDRQLLVEGNRRTHGLVRQLGPDAGGLRARRRHGDPAARARRPRRRPSRWSRWLTTLGHRSASASASSRTSTTAGPADLQFGVNERWIDVINSRYHVGIDGISLPLLILSMLITVLCIVYSWNHFPEPHNPKAFLALILLLEIGHERHVRRPGPHPLLHLLRDRAAPDVLHDRRVGRSQPRVRVDQVLPVHAVRLGADAAELPGAVLPLKARTFDMVPLLARSTATGIVARHPAPDLRRACSSASRSRCRCSRSTPGCPTPTPRRRPSARCCWPRSC